MKAQIRNNIKKSFMYRESTNVAHTVNMTINAKGILHLSI